MQQVLLLFLTDSIGIMILITLLILLVVQLYYYYNYYRKPYIKAIHEPNEDARVSDSAKMVSVIISSENEVMRLSKNLPIILEQDYPNFEVIVINNGSTDETDDLIDSLKLKHSNLYCTYVPYSNDKDFGRRKLAFTLGAKAAKGEILIFIEPHVTPLSQHWISLMTKDIDDNIEVVLGASYFSSNDKFFHRIARFDNHLFNMQFLSKAIEKKPFTGVYGNVAFKKDLFFDNKGFASHLALENGEDVFINQIVNETNTSVCLNPDGFTEADIDNYSLWKRIKKNYSIARLNFKDKSTQFFRIELVSRILFYLVFIGGSVYAGMNFNWLLLGLLLFVFIARLINQIVVINQTSKYFKSGKFYSSIPLIDVLQPLYNLSFRTRRKKIRKFRS